MHCTKCGAAVPDGATFCPNCGEPVAGQSSGGPAPRGNPFNRGSNDTPPKKQSKLLGCLSIGAIILVLLFMLGQCAGDPASQTNTAEAELAANGDVAAGELPLAVTATELFNAYENNEASAQGYFGGRKLLVSGTVEKVTLDFSDDPVVGLRTPNQFMTAQASLADDAKGQAGSFNPGDKVKLLCEDVSEVVGTPMLKDCRTAPAGQKSQPVQWSK